MEIQIKKFHQLSLEQLYQLLKLRMDVFVVEQNCPYPELDNADQSADHIFIENAEGIQAYLRLHEFDDGNAKIGRVVTGKNFRGKGASRKLVEKALHTIRENQICVCVILQAQDYLTDFYASFGFEKTSKVYLEDGIPHVDMELSLRN